MTYEIPKMQRIVLLGGGKLLTSLVDLCHLSGLAVSVVTSPRHAQEMINDNSSFLDFLEQNSIQHTVVKSISSTEAQSFLGDTSDAFCLSIGAAWIFTKPIIKKLFNDRLFNMHGTRLPQNRGGGGFSWQIMMGNRLGFCQLHLIDGGVDTGNIIKTKEFLFPPSCRIPRDYEALYAKEALAFIIELLKKVMQTNVTLQSIEQSEYLSTYWPRLNTPINAWIDWRDDAHSLERFICAFDEPYAGAQTIWKDQIIHIKDVMIDYSDPLFHSYQSGIVYRKGPNWLCVCANGGTLIVQSISNKDGDNLLDEIKVGDRLSTPISKMDSRLERISYTPTG